jgi:hypothetical protein
MLRLAAKPARGAQSLELARGAPPGPLLLDLRLPYVPGKDALGVMFADPILRSTPVDILSLCRRAGVDRAAAGAAWRAPI